MQGVVAVLTCYVLWGFIAAYWSLFASIDSIAVLAFRIIWSMVFCLILISIERKWGEVRRLLRDRRQILLLLLAGLAVTVNWGGYITAVTGGRVLDASLAYYMYPLFSIVIGYAVYGERLRRAQWVAFFLAMIGVAVPVVVHGTFPAFAMMIGISFAIYGAIKKKVTVSGVLSIFMETGWVVPLALIYLAFFTDLSTVSTAQWWLLPTTGIATGVPLILFAIGMQTTSLSLAGILMYINPTIQLLIGVFFYGEAFTKVHAVTFAFVWVAVAIFLFDSFKHRDRSEEVA